MQHRYAKLFRFTQLGVDLLMLNIAFFVAGAIRFTDLRVENIEYYNYYVQLFVFINLAWVVVAALLNSFAFSPTLEIRKGVAKVFNTILIHTAVLALLLVSLKGYYYSRLFFTYFYIMFVPLVLLARVAVMQRIRAFLSKPEHARPVVVLGNNKAAAAFVAALGNHPEYGLKVAAWFGGGEGDHLTGQLDDAEKWMMNHKIAELYCALPDDEAQLAYWLRWADAHLVRFRYLPILGLKNVNNAVITLMGDVPVLVPRKEPLELRHNRLLKRAFDLILSLLVILLIFPWLFPVVAIAIKLSSNGPVLFTQKRSGLGNTVFTVLKFRTMRPNAAADKLQARADDARITQVGSFLRKHNIDELPQFFNVLLGHMSVVGPRPHMLQHTAQYRALINEFMVRHLIKPGITGLAQTRGFRGETQNPNAMRDRVRADVYYLENWSLLLDFRIVWDTVINMITGKNAGV